MLFVPGGGSRYRGGYKGSVETSGYKHSPNGLFESRKPGAEVQRPGAHAQRGAGLTSFFK